MRKFSLGLFGIALALAGASLSATDFMAGWMLCVAGNVALWESVS